MKHVSLADAKARLSELVTEAEHGGTVEITRRGKVVARLVPAEPAKQPIDAERLRAYLGQLNAPLQSTDESIYDWKGDERY